MSKVVVFIIGGVLIIACSSLVSWYLCKRKHKPTPKPEPDYQYWNPSSHTHVGFSYDYDVQRDIGKTHTHRSVKGEETVTHSHLPVNNYWGDHTHPYMRRPPIGGKTSYGWRRNATGDWVHKHTYAIHPKTGKKQYIEHLHP